MSIIRTYRKALLAFVAALAVALAGVGAAPGAAWASVADGVVGLNVNVPSTVQQAPGAEGDAGTRGSLGVVGLNLAVPDTVGEGEPGHVPGTTGASGATGVLGLNLNVPSTVEQAPGAVGEAGGKGSPGVLGLNLNVPSTVTQAPGSVGDAAGSTGVLGLNLNVPSTVTQAPGVEGDTAGAAGVLGLNMNVPRGNYVTFDANGGQGSWLVPIVPGEPVRAPEGSEGGFFWPARVIEGWYTDAACTPDARWDFDTVPEGTMTLYAHWVLAEEPHPEETVELHVVYENVTLDGSGYGVSGYEGPLAGDDGHGPVYVGAYLLGGDMPPNLDGTLALPEPEMTSTEDLDGLFDGWYRTCSFDDAGNPTYADKVSQNANGAYAIGRYETGEKVFWAKWKTVRTHQVAFDPGDGAWADGSTDVRVLRVEHGSPVYAPSPAPALGDYDFVEWRRADGSRYAFGSPVYEDMTLVAHYEPVPEFEVVFDAGAGHFVGEGGEQEQTRSEKVRRDQRVARPEDPVREGFTFAGWYTDGTFSTVYDFDRPVTRALTLYARWVEAELPPEGTWTVTFDAAGGAWEGDAGPEAVRVLADVTDGALLAQPEPPKRAGWQLPGTGAWALEDGTPWDFGRDVVTGDLTLYAKWALRLDVTVPVSVAFAVDAATGEAAGPDAYALRSRTVRAVEVESLALESRQGELEAFFALAEGEEGGAAPTWADALAATSLSLAPAGTDAVALPFAGEEANGLWSTLRELGADERASWTMAAFDYGATGATPDDAWQGEDPSVRLPLALALEISDDLEVLTGQEGSMPITRLKVTVSARP